jgi:hypothetical protein
LSIPGQPGSDSKSITVSSSLQDTLACNCKLAAAAARTSNHAITGHGHFCCVGSHSTVCCGSLLLSDRVVVLSLHTVLLQSVCSPQVTCLLLLLLLLLLLCNAL